MASQVGTTCVGAGEGGKHMSLSGLLFTSVTAVDAAALAANTTAFTTTLAKNTLNGPGKMLRIRMMGTTNATAGSRTVRITIGSVTTIIASNVAANSLYAFDVLVARLTLTTQELFITGVHSGAVVVSPIRVALTQNLGTDLTIAGVINGIAGGAAAEITHRLATIEMLTEGSPE